MNADSMQGLQNKAGDLGSRLSGISSGLRGLNFSGNALGPIGLFAVPALNASNDNAVSQADKGAKAFTDVESKIKATHQTVTQTDTNQQRGFNSSTTAKPPPGGANTALGNNPQGGPDYRAPSSIRGGGVVTAGNKTPSGPRVTGPTPITGGGGFTGRTRGPGGPAIGATPDVKGGDAVVHGPRSDVAGPSAVIGGAPTAAKSPPSSPGWTGESGLQLTTTQNAVADDFLQRAQQAEPRITQSMQSISNNVPNGQLIGLDFRLKSEDSLKRKFATLIRTNPDLTADETIESIKDTPRYTMQIDSGNYSSGVQHAVRALRMDGYENVGFRNSWDSAGYQGINSNWRDPVTGQTFEVQFHTQDSFEAKTVTHDLYEQVRLPGLDEATKQALTQQLASVYKNVPRPSGATDLRA